MTWTFHSRIQEPSPWIVRNLPRAQPGQSALDVATGAGRHLRYALSLGYTVTAIDRDLSRVTGPACQPGAKLIQAGLEDGTPWPLPGATFDAVIVTNYLHRPCLPAIIASVGPVGLLLYETFAAGQSRYGKPSNPHFLLEPGELLAAVRDHLTPIAFEHATLDNPARVVQRIAAVGPHHPWRDDPPPTTGPVQS